MRWVPAYKAPPELACRSISNYRFHSAGGAGMAGDDQCGSSIDKEGEGEAWKLETWEHEKNHGSFDSVGHTQHVARGTGGSGRLPQLPCRKGLVSLLWSNCLLPIALRREAAARSTGVCKATPVASARDRSLQFQVLTRHWLSTDVPSIGPWSGDLRSLAAVCMATGMSGWPEQGTQIASITHP